MQSGPDPTPANAARLKIDCRPPRCQRRCSVAVDSGKRTIGRPRSDEKKTSATVPAAIVLPVLAAHPWMKRQMMTVWMFLAAPTPTKKTFWQAKSAQDESVRGERTR